MKIPSLSGLSTKAFQTIKRFPLALFASFMVASILIYMIHQSIEPMEEQVELIKLVQVFYLGMLCFIALPVFLERSGRSFTQRIGIQLAVVILLIAYYFTMPEVLTKVNIIRFFLISVALHFLIAFLPYIGHQEENGFWQYNKTLFLRILLTGLYSVVLFGGLALAIAAIDQLFVVHFNGKIYGYLWVSIAVVFSCWFFLAGFPDDFNALDADQEYPKGLKIFTQFVLLPLISIYLLILYTYCGKIIFTWQWPDGWVSNLVLFFSIAGILSLLLIHPVRFDERNKWIPTYSRIFYYAVFPLIILLFFAIKRRISDYGITEPRYFVMLLALWLLFIATYFSISKSKNIKIIPISLFLISSLACFGPWGAFQISKNSQKKHLEQLLEKNSMLKNGQIVPAKAKINRKDEAEISSVVDYLITYHHYGSLQNYFKDDLSAKLNLDSSNRNSTYDQSRKVLELMGLKYINRWGVEASADFYYSMEEPTVYELSDYSIMLPRQEFYQNSEPVAIRHANRNYLVSSDFARNKFKISCDGEVLELELLPFLESLKTATSNDKNQISAAAMSRELKGKKFDVKIFFTELNGREEGNVPILNSLHALILVKEQN